MDSGYANLQSKVGFIYGGISVMSIIFVFFCVPECQGRSFEEIDQLFRSGTPLRAFQKQKQLLDVTEIEIKGISKQG